MIDDNDMLNWDMDAMLAELGPLPDIEIDAALADRLQAELAAVDVEALAVELAALAAELDTEPEATVLA